MGGENNLSYKIYIYFGNNIFYTKAPQYLKVWINEVNENNVIKIVNISVIQKLH